MYPFNVWFVCKLCRSSFQSIDQFVVHKKEKHVDEFGKIKYIVFEETALDQELFDVFPNSFAAASDKIFNNINEGSPCVNDQHFTKSEPENVVSLEELKKKIYSSGRKSAENDGNVELKSHGSLTVVKLDSSMPAPVDADHYADAYVDPDADINDSDNDDAFMDSTSVDFGSESDFIPQDFVVTHLNSGDADSFKSSDQCHESNANFASPSHKNLTKTSCNPYVLLVRLTKKEIEAAGACQSNGRRIANSNTYSSTLHQEKNDIMTIWDHCDSGNESTLAQTAKERRSWRRITPHYYGDNDCDSSGSDSKNWNSKSTSKRRKNSTELLDLYLTNSDEDSSHENALNSKRKSQKNRKRVKNPRQTRNKNRSNKYKIKTKADSRSSLQGSYNNHGQFIFPTMENPQDRGDPSLTLTQWLIKEKSLCGSSFASNKILLTPDLTLNVNPEKKSEIIEPLPDPTPDTPVSCKLCCLELVSPSELRIHVKYCWQFNKKRHRYCTMCDKTVAEPKYLRKHILKVHGVGVFRAMDYTFKCQLCPRVFVKEIDFTNHKKNHKTGDFSNDVADPLEDILKTDEGNISVDIDIADPNSPFLCKVCSKSFSTQDILDDHSKMHMFNRPFKCPMPNCSRDFKYIDSLKTHIRQHERVNMEINPGLSEAPVTVASSSMSNINANARFKSKSISRAKVKKEANPLSKITFCDICEKPFATPLSYRIHTLRFHLSDEEKARYRSKYPCSICPKKFQHRHSLKLHEETHKSKEEQSRPFVCEFCGLSSRSRGDLNKHVRIHSEDRPFKCTYPNCEQAFKMKRGLRSHEKRTHSDEKPVKCSFLGCEKAFKTKQELKQHFVTHTGERAFICKEENCGKSFTSASILRRHVVAKHDGGGGDHPCEFCDKVFKLKAYLSSHMLVHMKERPLKCTFAGCEMAFKRRRGLIEHERKHTGEQPYQCDLCGKAFARMTHFHTHMRKHKAAAEQEQVQNYIHY